MAEEQHALSDSEIALMDSIKVVFEVLIANKIVRADALEEKLLAQRRTYQSPPEMGGALYVVDELRRVLKNLERA